ncbi:hypothetical protein MCUN1_003559 [Malassezia cuniculi]|uniref:RRM domain-containing protein n=1 Tax=Malassezia cuniculi TaxID=948313 RepID=A0AAF0J7J0_9BASI|nr:hypothetical protein MCUN1_003559 [Malassezia cuniculi]
MDASQGAGNDPYAPFYYWDAAAGKWEFDYDGFYRSQNAQASTSAAGSSSSSGAVTTNVDLVQQAQQSAAYEPKPERKSANATTRIAGHLEKGQTRETVIRRAAGKMWEDQTLLDWDPTHKRLFVGDLGNDVHDDTLTRAFMKYPSFSKARVVRKKSDGKSKGYGFVAFADPEDFLRAWKEMDGKYIGSRPCRLKKANDNVQPVQIGARKDRLLMANARRAQSAS